MNTRRAWMWGVSAAIFAVMTNIEIQGAQACSPGDFSVGSGWADPDYSDLPERGKPLPSNTLFPSVNLDPGEDPEPPIWERVVEGRVEGLELELAERIPYGLEAPDTELVLWRPVTALEPGDEVQEVGCEGCNSPAIPIGEADTRAPAVRDLKRPTLYLNPRHVRRGAACGAADGYVSAELDFEESSPGSIILAFVAPTPEELAQKTTPTYLHVESPTHYQTHEIGLFLGDETSSSLSTQRPFCLAVEVIDITGARSERSPALCLDPRDDRAPYAAGPGLRGGLCATAAPTTPASPPSPWVLWVGVAGLALARRARCARGR